MPSEIISWKTVCALSGLPPEQQAVIRALYVMTFGAHLGCVCAWVLSSSNIYKPKMSQRLSQSNDESEACKRKELHTDIYTELKWGCCIIVADFLFPCMHAIQLRISLIRHRLCLEDTQYKAVKEIVQTCIASRQRPAVPQAEMRELKCTVLGTTFGWNCFIPSKTSNAFSHNLFLAHMCSKLVKAAA